MHIYKLKYHKNNVMLIAMIGFPVLFISLVMYCIFGLFTSLSEGMMLMLVSLSIISMALMLFWVAKTQVFVNSKVLIGDDGIGFKLKSTSLLYRRTDFFSGWENVSRVTEMFDNNNGGYYYQIEFKNPHFVANFNPVRDLEAEADRFFSGLEHYQENYHISNHLPLNTKLQPSNSF
ncbi:hypothetical protein DBR40_06040 [Pedobacter sp. KBW01]|uniref:hypothetical protein n=1 Tax=Pedobacter sp. KBW01 TaxID=2153364 RepID=UPI000F594A4D|nr:hypothetical protein [Pedobacter sp. KBW01]RQO78503.1 hypothetical protein DBR40_06040 [Pedobacter sp. KBW01]